MAFDFSTLVTDRKQNDVAYVKQLIAKIVAGTETEAELAEWKSFTLKGSYNYTDLNRVTAAMEDLKLRLEGYGYAVPWYQYIEPFSESDWPTPQSMAVYLQNVDAIRSVLTVLASTPKVPDDMMGLIVKEANDIEVILMDVYRQLTIMPTTFIPCGEALSGGDNL